MDFTHATEATAFVEPSDQTDTTSAEQASAAKDHFLALLSHELRTPLTPIVATLSMLQRKIDLDAEVRECLEIIRRNVEVEIRLIDDLLDVTRIARGKIELNKQPVEISAIVSRAVEICRPDIEERRLCFQVDMKQLPHTVYADPVRLQQMFWNLIKNAIKFTPPGGRVEVRGWREDGQVVVEVNDSGVGIEAEALDRIFNAFEQVDPAVTRRFGGLGLGLAISKGMAELHGGRIEAHSDGRDRGATFTVRLPIANVALTAPLEADQMDKSPVANGRQLKILLVEDHKDSAEMLSRLLTGEGHEVHVAGDMAAGLDAARHNGFDVMLSDLSLPDGSGADLIRQLCAHGQTMPGIALSGYGQEQDVRWSLGVGFAAHLTKPVNFDQLNRTISAVVGLAAEQSR